MKPSYWYAVCQPSRKQQREAMSSTIKSSISPSLEAEQLKKYGLEQPIERSETMRKQFTEPSNQNQTFENKSEQQQKKSRGLYNTIKNMSIKIKEKSTKNREDSFESGMTSFSQPETRKSISRNKTFAEIPRNKDLPPELERAQTYEDYPEQGFKKRDKSPTKMAKNVKIAACVVKIYRGHGLDQSSNYKSILASNVSTGRELIELALARYGVVGCSWQLFQMYESFGYFKTSDGHILEDGIDDAIFVESKRRIVSSNEQPLAAKLKLKHMQRRLTICKKTKGSEYNDGTSSSSGQVQDFKPDKRLESKTKSTDSSNMSATAEPQKFPSKVPPMSDSGNSSEIKQNKNNLKKQPARRTRQSPSAIIEENVTKKIEEQKPPLPPAVPQQDTKSSHSEKSTLKKRPVKERKRSIEILKDHETKTPKAEVKIEHPYLLMLQKPDDHVDFGNPITPLKNELGVVGSTVDCDLRLLAKHVSPVHCQIRQKYDNYIERLRFYLKPVDGIVFHNKSKLKDDLEAEIQSGDLIGVGEEYEFFFINPKQKFGTPRFMRARQPSIQNQYKEMFGDGNETNKIPGMPAVPNESDSESDIGDLIEQPSKSSVKQALSDFSKEFEKISEKHIVPRKKRVEQQSSLPNRAVFKPWVHTIQFNEADERHVLDLFFTNLNDLYMTSPEDHSLESRKEQMCRVDDLIAFACYIFVQAYKNNCHSMIIANFNKKISAVVNTLCFQHRNLNTNEMADIGINKYFDWLHNYFISMRIVTQLIGYITTDALALSMGVSKLESPIRQNSNSADDIRTLELNATNLVKHVTDQFSNSMKVALFHLFESPKSMFLVQL